MKQSKFNFIKTIKNKNYLFNSLTRGLAEIEDEVATLLFQNDIENLPTEHYDLLVKEKYIIPQNTDEIEEMKKQYVKAQKDYKKFSFVIAPTLQCNFRCSYCFQEHKNLEMNQETISEVIEFIVSKLKKYSPQKINICWYGGEPLLNHKAILEISKNIIPYCDQNKILYRSNIITNGYLLDKVPTNFFEVNKITAAQITIDGPSRIHNKRRILTNGSPTFDQIIENIKTLVKNEIDVNIRINIDKTNKEHLAELINELEEKNLKNTSFSLGHVKDFTEVCKNVKNVKIADKEFRKSQKQFFERIKTYSNNNLLQLPEKTINCGAVAKNTFVIDPNGYIYKCWNDVGIAKRAQGKLKDHLLKKSLFEITNPFMNQKCLECKGFPLCLGGCSYEYIYKDYLDCIDYDEMIENYIETQI